MTVASQGPAGRVLVSQGSPSDPPPDISFHLPGAAEGSKGQEKGPWCMSLQMSISAAVCLCGHVCPSCTCGRGMGRSVWRRSQGPAWVLSESPIPPTLGWGQCSPLCGNESEGTTRWKGREPQALWPGPHSFRGGQLTEEAYGPSAQLIRLGLGATLLSLVTP